MLREKAASSTQWLSLNQAFRRWNQSGKVKSNVPKVQTEFLVRAYRNMESRRKQEALHIWRSFVVESSWPKPDPSADSALSINHALQVTLSQVASTLEDRLNARKATLHDLKRSQAATALFTTLSTLQQRAKHFGWHSLEDAASGNLRC